MSHSPLPGVLCGLFGGTPQSSPQPQEYVLNPFTVEIRTPDTQEVLNFLLRFKNLRDFDRYLLSPGHQERTAPNWSRLSPQNVELAHSFYSANRTEREKNVKWLLFEFSYALKDMSSLSHEYVEFELLKVISTSKANVKSRLLELFMDENCLEFDAVVAACDKLLRISDVVEQGRAIPGYQPDEQTRHNQRLEQMKKDLNKILKHELPQLLTLAKEEYLPHVKREFHDYVILVLADLPRDKSQFTPESRMAVMRSMMVAGELMKLLPDRFLGLDYVRLIRSLRNSISHTITRRLHTFFNDSFIDFFMDMSELLQQIYAHVFLKQRPEPNPELVEKLRMHKNIPNDQSAADTDERKDLQKIIDAIMLKTKPDCGFVLWDCVIGALDPQFIELRRVPDITEAALLQTGNSTLEKARFLHRKNDTIYLDQEALPHVKRTFRIGGLLKDGNLQNKRRMMLNDPGDKMEFLVKVWSPVLSKLHNIVNSCLVKMRAPLEISEELLQVFKTCPSFLATDRALLLAKRCVNLCNPLDYPPSQIRSQSIKQFIEILLRKCPELDPSTASARKQSDSSASIRLLAFTLVSILNEQQSNTSSAKCDAIEFDVEVLRKLRNFWAHPGPSRPFPAGLKSDGSSVTEAEALGCLIYMTQLHLDLPHFDQLRNDGLSVDIATANCDFDRRRSASESAAGLIS